MQQKVMQKFDISYYNVGEIIHGILKIRVQFDCNGVWDRNKYIFCTVCFYNEAISKRSWEKLWRKRFEKGSLFRIFHKILQYYINQLKAVRKVVICCVTLYS